MGSHNACEMAIVEAHCWFIETDMARHPKRVKVHTALNEFCQFVDQSYPRMWPCLYFAVYTRQSKLNSGSSRERTALTHSRSIKNMKKIDNMKI